MSGMEAAAEIGLRLLGAFYAAAGVIALRAGAKSFLLGQAFAAIGRPDPREAQAERWRVGWIAVNSLLVGTAGIALVALLDLAALLFPLTAVFYAVYLFVVAPRFLDPVDPPEEPGRSRTRNAFFAYLLATLLVLVAASSGVLLAARDQPAFVLVIVGALILALVAYGVRLMAGMRLPAGPGPDGDGGARRDGTD